MSRFAPSQAQRTAPGFSDMLYTVMYYLCSYILMQYQQSNLSSVLGTYDLVAIKCVQEGANKECIEIDLAQAGDKVYGCAWPGGGYKENQLWFGPNTMARSPILPCSSVWTCDRFGLAADQEQ